MEMEEFQKVMRMLLRNASGLAQRSALYCGDDEFEGCVLYESLLELEEVARQLITFYVEAIPACSRDDLRRLRKRYVAVIGDQSETQICYGPFDGTDPLIDWTRSVGVEDGRVSFYEITNPAVAPEVAKDAEPTR